MVQTNLEWNHIIDFAQTKGYPEEETIQEIFFEDHKEMLDLAGKLISLEHSIFFLRRANGICGSNVDYLTSIYNNFKKEFEGKFDEWKSPNIEQMW